MRDNRSLEQKIKTVVRESSEKRNSEIRMKMSNVGRPTDDASKLAKQGEIKTKIIDEDTAVASVSTKDTPKEQPELKKKKDTDNKDLMEPGTIKGGKTEVDLEPSTDDRDDDGKKISDKMKKATKEANAKAGVKEETMTNKNFGLPADLIAAVTEALKGGQKKLDANHNGKIDGQDFKILKDKKKVEEEVEEVNEISQKLATKAYAHVANDMRGKSVNAGAAGTNQDRFKEKIVNKFGAKAGDKADKAALKLSKANEEVESIDELSKDTLVSYALKAHRRGDMAARMSKKGDGTGYDKDTAHIANKRYDGVQTAIKKIATKEETDPGFSAEELARIEEIANNIDEVVTARKLTPADKVARAKYLEGHAAKMAGMAKHAIKGDAKSFKARNTEHGDYSKEPSKMAGIGLDHTLTKQDIKR
jgi:hypothetical protein